MTHSPSAGQGIRLPAAQRAGRTHAQVRTDVAVVLWLKGKDLAAMTTHPGLVRAGAGVYALAVAALLAGAAYVHQSQPLATSATGSVLVPLWLLWALLPAIGGGGGVVESAASLAPYPVRARVHLLSAWLSAALDLQYLVPVPALAGALVATYGLSALVPAAAFVVGASGIGQLLAWAVGGGLRPARGAGLGGTVFAVAGVAGMFLVRGRDALSSMGVLPTGWLSAACRAGAAGSWWPWAGWSVVAAAPALVLAGVGTRLTSRALLARAAGRTSLAGARRATSKGLPRHPVAALTLAATLGVLRSVAFRAAALMALAVPFVTAAVFPTISGMALVSMTLISGGASVTANAWAFDAGGVVIWLTSPLSHGALVLARAGAAGAALVILLGAVTVSALAAGVPGLSAGTAGFAALLTLVVTSAGLRTATKYPSAADLDSLRGRPTTVWAALTYTVRAGVGAALLAGMWAVPGPGPGIAAAGVGAYCGWAVWAVRRSLRDGAPIMAAFAGIR